MADIAHAGYFHRPRGTAEGGDVPPHKYPNVVARMGRVWGREGLGASVWWGIA